jgi:hypothetical protein
MQHNNLQCLLCATCKHHNVPDNSHLATHKSYHMHAWAHAMRAPARTLLSAVALAGASSSLHSWSMTAGPALEHLFKAFTGVHCMRGGTWIRIRIVTRSRGRRLLEPSRLTGYDLVASALCGRDSRDVRRRMAAQQIAGCWPCTCMPDVWSAGKRLGGHSNCCYSTSTGPCSTALVNKDSCALQRLQGPKAALTIASFVFLGFASGLRGMPQAK